VWDLAQNSAPKLLSEIEKLIAELSAKRPKSHRAKR